MNKYTLFGIFLILLSVAAALFLQPEEAPGPGPASYARSVRLLKTEIWQENRVTIYCGAHYDASGAVQLPTGFKTPGHASRSARMEWEHAVPVESFGRAFKEWREGHPVCVHKGKAYKGRKCATKASAEFREMEADMFNLFPSIGSVNAVRANRPYAELPDLEPGFGSCPAKVGDKRFEPPDHAKGQLARASLYMDWRYEKFRLSASQKKLFQAWDKKFPPDEEECKRGRLIQKFQHKENIFISRACAKASP